MSAIKIEQVFFDELPSGELFITIKHKLTSDADVNANYVTDATDVPIQPSGALMPVFYIDGLMPATSYTVKIILQCNNTFVQEDYVTPQGCPDVENINGSTGGGDPQDQYIL